MIANHTLALTESQRKAVAEELARVLSDAPEDVLVMETGGNSLESLVGKAPERLQQRSKTPYPSIANDTLLRSINSRIVITDHQNASLYVRNVSGIAPRSVGVSASEMLPKFEPEDLDPDPNESLKQLNEPKKVIPLPKWFAPSKKAPTPAPAPSPAPAPAPAPGDKSVDQEPPRIPANEDEELLNSYFGTPLTMDDYFLRDWFWIRCHSLLDIKLSVGGSWPGPHGKHLMRELEASHCGLVVNWTFEYVNGQNWGDAVVRMMWFEPRCGVKEVVLASIKLAKMAGWQKEREFYIYSCPAGRDEPGWRNEVGEMGRIKEKGGYHGKGG
jgi:hypothetical protein